MQVVFNIAQTGTRRNFSWRRFFRLVRRVVPQAKFLAVGNAASFELRSFRGLAGFESVDFVPDLRPYLAKASVAIAPLTVGSGVSNKLLEAFATGTPIVATSLACGDLPVRSQEHLLVANDPETFADAIVTLLRDAVLRQRLALAARQLVFEQYDWEVVHRRLETVFLSLLGEANASTGTANGNRQTFSVSNI